METNLACPFQCRNNREVDSSIILRATRKYINEKCDYNNHVNRFLVLRHSIFERNFGKMSNHESLRLFRFKKLDVMRMIVVVGCDDVPHKSTKRYSTISLLCTAVPRQRLASPFRLQDLEMMFGEHAPRLFEISWETPECFQYIRKGLLLGELKSNFLQQGWVYIQKLLRKIAGRRGTVLDS